MEPEATPTPPRKESRPAAAVPERPGQGISPGASAPPRQAAQGESQSAAHHRRQAPGGPLAPGATQALAPVALARAVGGDRAAAAEGGALLRALAPATDCRKPRPPHAAPSTTA